MKSVQSPADIPDFFRRNQTPLYYVSTSTFNLLGPTNGSMTSDLSTPSIASMANTRIFLCRTTR